MLSDCPCHLGSQLTSDWVLVLWGWNKVWSVTAIAVWRVKSGGCEEKKNKQTDFLIFPENITKNKKIKTSYLQNHSFGTAFFKIKKHLKFCL